MNARDLELTIPGGSSTSTGSYGSHGANGASASNNSHSTVVNISKFSPSMSVLMSKQRPRHMQLTGSDGILYRYVQKLQKLQKFENVVNCVIYTRL